MKGPTLRGELLGWTLAALILMWSAFVAVGYGTGKEEADELTDGHLAGVAALMIDLQGGAFRAGEVGPVAGGRTDLKAHDYQQSMQVIVWDANGTVLTRSGNAPLPAFTPQEGFVTLSLGQPAVPWRSFSRWTAPRDRKVMVMLSLNERDALARDIADQIMEPGLWLLPLLALGLGFAIHRGLRPLGGLSSEINALDIERPEPLATQNRHQEFRIPVEAINRLVVRYHASLLRERALADEFAHELRTPLTSLSLQVRALRDGLTQTGQAMALDRIEDDARRAGDVVTHLLALARISRTHRDEAMLPLDLTELARSIVAESAPMAYASGHELALSAAGPLLVRGNAVLLEMALRNLIDNAIGHTPPGTQVEVQVLPDLVAVQVCDGPSASAPRRAAAGADGAGRSLGLGLGHQVVQKVADLHGARFGRVEPPEGFASCYRLAFEAAPALMPAPSGRA